jgi:4-amino-4-deoxy-L-arabinose transferase-like glycosyltransferase
VFSRFPQLWLCAIWAALFLLGVTGYPNLLDNERRIAAYALDVLQNGNWIVQHDFTGDFMSKPPALTWLVAVFSLCTGGLSLFALYLPSALATLGVALLVFRAGKDHFSERAGLLAALMYLLSYVTDRQLTTARYDGLFALPVMIGALAAYRGWREGKGWFVFWVAMAAGAMVKGPLIFLLSGFGLLACLWERDPGFLFRWRWQHAAGIAFFIFICGGWLLLVLIRHRDEFVDKMLVRELVAQAVNDAGNYPLQHFWEAPLNSVVNFLPWSILGIWGLVKALRDRRKGEGRSFERFLACWFLVGLILFSVAAHQRGRLIWPLVPPLALFAGRELDGWWKEISDRIVYRWAAAVTVLTFAASALFHEELFGKSARSQQTLAMRKLATMLRKGLGEKPPVVYVDAPFAVQFYLGYLRFNTPASQAAAALNGTSPAYVVASDRSLEQISGLATNQVFTLYAWPANAKPTVRLLSNRPELAAQ